MPKKKKIKKKKIVRPQLILPTEKTVIAQRFQDYMTAVYGPPGVGKTKFMEDVTPRTFFISTDRGTRYMPALRLEANNWKEVLRIIKALEKEPSKYNLCVFDHTDDICLMAEDYICDALGIDALGDAGYAKGWRAYKKEIWGAIQRVQRLNMGVGFIFHETIKTIRTTVMETERTVPDLTKSSQKVIIPKCDLIGYCGFKRIRSGGKRKEVRIIRTVPTQSIYAKDRTTRRKPEEGEVEYLNGKSFAETFTMKGVKHGKKKKVLKKKRTKKAARR